MNTLSVILAGAAPLLTQVTLVPSPIDDTMSVLASSEARVLGNALSYLAQETKRNSDAVVGINEALHVLTRLEQAQATVLERLQEGSAKMNDHELRLRTVERDLPDKAEQRLAEIEKALPGLAEARRWVIAGVLFGITALGAALLKLVIVDVPRIPQYVQQAPQQAPQPAPAPRQGP